MGQAEDPIQDGQGSTPGLFGFGLADLGLGDKVEDRGQALNRVERLGRGESDLQRLGAFLGAVAQADELAPGVPQFFDQTLGRRGTRRMELAGRAEQSLAETGENIGDFDNFLR